MAWGSISLFGGFLENENSLETLIVIFENVSPKGSFWLKVKYFEISVWRRILDIYKQPLLMIRFKPIFDLSRMAWHTLESNTLIFGIPFSITPSLLSVSVGFQQQS